MSESDMTQSNGWLSWFTLGYFGTSETPNALGRNAPSKNSKEFTKFLRSDEGKFFIATTPEELQNVRKNLRNINFVWDESKIPPAPPAPVNTVVLNLMEPKNYLEEIKKKITPYPSHEEENGNWSLWRFLY